MDTKEGVRGGLKPLCWELLRPLAQDLNLLEPVAKQNNLICIEHHMSVVAVFLVVTDRFPRVKWFTVWGGHQMLKNTEIQHLVTT